jgi:hypothetical protein
MLFLQLFMLLSVPFLHFASQSQVWRTAVEEETNGATDDGGGGAICKTHVR